MVLLVDSYVILIYKLRTMKIKSLLMLLLCMFAVSCGSDNDELPLDLDTLVGTIWEGSLEEVTAVGEVLKVYKIRIEFTETDYGYCIVIPCEEAAVKQEFDYEFHRKNQIFINMNNVESCPLEGWYDLIKSNSNYMVWERFQVNSMILTLRKKI